MKFCVVMPAAETTSPAVSTCAPWSNTTPAWLTITIWPLAVMCPAISDGSGPTTVFSAMAELSGCLKLTVCALPTLKLCQVSAADWLCWLMVVVLPDWVIPAWPPTTAPPVGRALGAICATAGVARTASAVPCSRARRRVMLSLQRKKSLLF